MKVQDSKSKVQGLGIKAKRLLLYCFIALLLCLSQSLAYSAEKWSGVDESVIERFAKEHGIESKGPLINTDQGDLLLFVFLFAGAVGGFLAGYYWRILLEQGKKRKENAHIF